MPGDIVHFSFVVEGEGEEGAAPLLVRRICAEVLQFLAMKTARPVRVPRGKLVRPAELERAIRLARIRNRSEGPVLVLLDADEDCPAELGPRLKSSALAICEPEAVSIVIPRFEFEAWFLAAARSLSGKRGLREGLTPPDDPEGIRGAKEWLSRNMVPGRKYKETVDQAALVQAMDLRAAQSCKSFERLCREIERLVRST
jgi:hypothetical protein